MNSALAAHPEILKFKEDQKAVSPAISHYINEFRENNTSLLPHILEFFDKLGLLQSITKLDIDRLAKTKNFTQNTEQRENLFSQLRNVSKYYLPSIKNDYKGLIFDLTQYEWNGYVGEQLPKEIILKLDKFVSECLDKKIHFNPFSDYDFNNIGKLGIMKVGRNLTTFDVTSNPGLSIKDVMAKNMIETAIEEGTLKSGVPIVEGSSGNTGAGLAIMGAKLGFDLVITIPDKMSREKIERLAMLGAIVVICPTKVGSKSPFSYYSVRDYLSKRFHGWQASQYDNLANTEAHYKVTGPAIWDRTDGKVSAVVVTAGTCGTISGIGKYLKEKNPDIKVFAVDTVGSILYLLYEGYKIEEIEKHAVGYQIQGFGEDIHPKNFNKDVIDGFIRVSDAEGLAITRLMPAIGVLGGHSTGAVYAGYIKLLSSGKLSQDENVFMVFPDHGFPYRYDVYNKDWYEKNEYIDPLTTDFWCH